MLLSSSDDIGVVFWSPAAHLALPRRVSSYLHYIRVLHNQHKVANKAKVGIKSFYKCKSKLPPDGLDLMITGSKV